MTERSRAKDGVSQLFASSRFVEPRPVRGQQGGKLLLTALAVAIYAITSGAVWGSILAAWPFWLDGQVLRAWAVVGLFPAGEFVDTVVGLFRALVSVVTSSDSTAIGAAWGLAFTLSAAVGVAQGSAVAALVWVVTRLVAQVRRR